MSEKCKHPRSEWDSSYECMACYGIEQERVAKIEDDNKRLRERLRRAEAVVQAADNLAGNVHIELYGNRTAISYTVNNPMGVALKAYQDLRGREGDRGGSGA